MNKHQIALFASSKSDDWETPKRLYDELNEEFQFDFDPCPLHSTYDGLSCIWGRRAFVNPPYSKVTLFLKKAWEEIEVGHTDVAVFLLFAKTDTKWFHQYLHHRSEIRFLKGRLAFNRHSSKPVSNSMHPSMVCILRTRRKIIYTYRQKNSIFLF